MEYQSSSAVYGEPSETDTRRGKPAGRRRYSEPAPCPIVSNCRVDTLASMSFWQSKSSFPRALLLGARCCLALCPAAPPAQAGPTATRPGCRRTTRHGPARCSPDGRWCCCLAPSGASRAKNLIAKVLPQPAVQTALGAWSSSTTTARSSPVARRRASCASPAIRRWWRWPRTGADRSPAGLSRRSRVHRLARQGIDRFRDRGLAAGAHWQEQQRRRSRAGVGATAGAARSGRASRSQLRASPHPGPSGGERQQSWPSWERAPTSSCA